MPENTENLESLGRRIAEHRAKLGLTQQDLADRLAISRVAVSHVEAGMTDPGERTIALLASVFKVEPHVLVAGTTYPTARAERLPVVVAMHTEVDLQLALLDNDLAWLEQFRPADERVILDGWMARLGGLLAASHDDRERLAVRRARAAVRVWLDEHPRPAPS
jgi:transcriptional regulator with XRE-family HTH domain